MRGVFIRSQFRSHGVASCSAKLRRFHVLDGAVRYLRPDDYICDCDNPHEPCQALQGCFAIKCGRGEAFPNPASAQVNADWNERQASEEYDWKDQKEDDANVRVRNVAANLLRQNEKPRNTGSSNECNTNECHPVLREHEPGRSVISVVHKEDDGRARNGEVR